MVLFLAHEWHIVSFLVHEFVVEELIRDESAICSVARPVRRRSVTVEAEILALSHPVHELFANEFTHIRIRLAVEGHFDDLGSDRRELSLVRHEGADAPLLVPDEEILAGLPGVVDSSVQLLEVVSWPGCPRLISFHHLNLLLLFLSSLSF